MHLLRKPSTTSTSKTGYWWWLGLIHSWGNKTSIITSIVSSIIAHVLSLEPFTAIAGSWLLHLRLTKKHLRRLSSLKLNRFRTLVVWRRCKLTPPWRETVVFHCLESLIYPVPPKLPWKMTSYRCWTSRLHSENANKTKAPKNLWKENLSSKKSYSSTYHLIIFAKNRRKT